MTWIIHMSRIGLIGLGVVSGLALTLAAGYWIFQINYTYQGVLIDPPVPAPDFTLQDQTGASFRLQDQRGKIVLIFFGYTNCPDVCPVTLSQYRRIKAGLGGQADRVSFVFITVDPERDTPEKIKSYMANFDPAFHGLTGDSGALQSVWKDYGVYVEKQELGSAAGYLVDHSARIYLIDAQGNWRLNYPYGMEASQILRDVQHLLREG